MSVVYADGYVKRVDSRMIFGGPQRAYYIVVEFENPLRGNRRKRQMFEVNFNSRYCRKGAAVRLRINTSVPALVRRWVIDG